MQLLVVVFLLITFVGPIFGAVMFLAFGVVVVQNWPIVLAVLVALLAFGVAPYCIDWIQERQSRLSHNRDIALEATFARIKASDPATPLKGRCTTCNEWVYFTHSEGAPLHCGRRDAHDVQFVSA